MPNSDAFNGGSAYVALFRVADDHSGIVDKTTGATIGTPALTDAAIILKDDAALNNIVETSDFTYDDAGIPSIKIGTTIPDVLSFLKIAAPKKAGVSSVTREEKTSEAGLKIGGSSGGNGNPQYLLIHGGGEAGAKVLTTMTIVQIKLTSGSRSHKAGGFVMPTFEATGVACKATGGYAIPQALFETTIWGTIDAAARTIAKDAYEEVGMLTAAT